LIQPLDNALQELRQYKASLQKNAWRSDIQGRITTIDIIEMLIQERLYPASKQ